MSASLRDRQLARLCDTFESVEPGAPTLCDGWTAHDLAIHIWLIKRDPLSWAGLLVPALAAPRADRIRRRWSYRELIERLRAEPGAIVCMPTDRVEDRRHALGEYWIHTQDVARPNGVPQQAPDPDLESALRIRVRRATAQLHRRRTPGLVLALPDGRRHAISLRPPTIVVTGRPGELMCWAYGRETVADVEIEIVGRS